jgi:hypothetical protein
VPSRECALAPPEIRHAEHNSGRHIATGVTPSVIALSNCVRGKEVAGYACEWRVRIRAALIKQPMKSSH